MSVIKKNIFQRAGQFPYIPAGKLFYILTLLGSLPAFILTLRDVSLHSTRIGSCPIIYHYIADKKPGQHSWAQPLFGSEALTRTIVLRPGDVRV